jgi:hypothetical protein
MPDDTPPSAIVLTTEQQATIAQMDHEHYLQETSQRLQFQQDLALAVLKSLTLVNGGAVLALLTFIGNRQSAFNQAELAVGVECFAGGLAANLLAYLFGYFAQSQFMDVVTVSLWNAQHTLIGAKHDDGWKRPSRVGGALLAVGVVLAVASLALFAGGAIVVATSFVP